jgi:hypothetical protein
LSSRLLDVFCHLVEHGCQLAAFIAAAHRYFAAATLFARCVVGSPAIAELPIASLKAYPVSRARLNLQ